MRTDAVPEPKASDQLTEQECATYQWQMWTGDFGEAGQRRLKRSRVLVSRIGGVGSLVAYELAAAGVGHLVLAHAGNIRPSDLNRQLLMTHEAIGTPRIESVRKRLLELNPRLRMDAIGENLNATNAAKLAAGCDLIVDCAPRFEERFAMNDAAIAHRIPLIECAMYDMEVQITTIVPGKTPCLRCLFPELPPTWTREFPVFGAVAGTTGCLAAVDAIKVLSGVGDPLTGRMLRMDLREMSFRTLHINRRPDCAACGHLSSHTTVQQT